MIAKIDDRERILSTPLALWSQRRRIQRHLSVSEETIMALYARGMTTREIQGHLHELYGVDVSPARIASVTGAVLDEAKLWQNRSLEPVYPIVYLDRVQLNLRSHDGLQSQEMNLALGIDLKGYKQLLGLWIQEGESSDTWLEILRELRSRGVEDILVVCVDPSKSVSRASDVTVPKIRAQLDIVHLIRQSLQYVSWKERKSVARDLRAIYAAPGAGVAERELEAFATKWDACFPGISKVWRSRWENVVPFFQYPAPIRKVLYTTNAIESVHTTVRKVTAKRGGFPNADSVRKVLYLAIEKTSERWKRPIKNWPAALNHFTIILEEGVSRRDP